jgi:DNA (cytosine-5)-methyltransferase 1
MANNVTPLALDDRRPTSLDLFAGAGGFSVGLEAAGYRTVGAVEINEAAARTWQKNFPGRRLWSGAAGDMRKLDPREVQRQLRADGVDELDLITAGPPCQGFSRVGRAKLNSLSEKAGAFRRDPRNILYRRAIHFLEVLQPRTFIFENVTGILHLGGTNMAEVVCKAVADAGYNVRCAVLNAAWFGVPQSRERVFIVGVRKDLGTSPTFPLIAHHSAESRGLISKANLAKDTWENDDFFVPWPKLAQAEALKPAVNVKQALGDLPPVTGHLQRGDQVRIKREDLPALRYRPSRPGEYAKVMRAWPGFESSLVHDHMCRSTPRDFETFGLMQPGDRYPEALAIAKRRWVKARLKDGKAAKKDYIPPYRDDGFHDKWRKLIPTQPSWTVTAHLGRDTYSHIHYDRDQKRMITIREAARLQSFPDGFAFEGSMGDAFTQIGNAVPPLLAAAVARGIVSALQQFAGIDSKLVA